MDYFVGQIVPMAISYAPKQTALCNGQLMPINQNAALYGLLGLTFGGNTTAFALPNAGGRSMQGFGTGGSARALGATGGEATHALTIAEIPEHIHDVNAATQGSVGSDPTGMLFGTASTAIYGDIASGLTPLGGGPLSPAGSGAPHNNMQPSLAITFTIALAGVYPSRS